MIDTSRDGSSINDQPAQSRHPAGPAPSLRTFILAAIFFVLWLIPILKVGLTGKPVNFKPLQRLGIPRGVETQASNYLNNNYRTACLFTKRVGSWSNYYYQARLTGQTHWIDLDESDYTRLKVFGYRTRLRRMLAQQLKEEDAMQARRLAIATFIKQRFETLYPEEPKVAAIRFIRVAYKSGDPTIAEPGGHWTKPPLFTIPPRQQRLLSAHEFTKPGDAS